MVDGVDETGVQGLRELTGFRMVWVVPQALEMAVNRRCGTG